jgi:diguanylate cyclase (GGDEF)-like protein
MPLDALARLSPASVDAAVLALLLMAVWCSWLGCELLARLREAPPEQPPLPAAWAAALMLAVALLTPLGLPHDNLAALAQGLLLAPAAALSLSLLLRGQAAWRRSGTRRWPLRGLGWMLTACTVWALALGLALWRLPLPVSSALSLGAVLALWQLGLLVLAARLRLGTRRGALWRAVLALAAVLGSTLPAVQRLPDSLTQAPGWGLWLALVLLPGVVLLNLRRPLSLSLGHGRRVNSESQPAELVDALTTLPSRVGVERQLLAAVAQCDRQKSRLAVLALNLDGFSPVNASFGHEGGDELLRQVAQRLRSVLGPEDVAGRIGADDFVLLLPTPASRDALAALADQVLGLLGQPYQVRGREISLSGSAGIVLYPDHGGQARLLARADAAKLAAKRLGGACYAFFEPSMENDAREQLDLLRDLRQAIARQELELFYQPKIDAASGQVTAAEALLRWRHPARGLIAPHTFIPLAERFGLMRELGRWVIDAACQQARLWRDSGLRMRVAINLSAQQLRQPDIVEQLEQALERHRIQPALLTCEITETVAMEDTSATQQTLRRLGKLGLHLSIDDFGTGYSSLSYLRQLPAEELKIDRAFVTDVDSSSDARAVVDAVVKLAHALGLRVVAEGVENERQRDTLLALGCDELQGFLYARPMSPQAILLWAQDEHHRPNPAFRPSLFGETTRQGGL